MKVTVINGTEKHGVTYKLKEVFIKGLGEKAEVTEFYLPRDLPNFCAGCGVCFLKGEKLCKDHEYVEKIEKALLEADLLVFTSPVYVYHATGAMKNMLDHFGYRWMPHRPAKEMFGKRAVIITQCLGGGDSSTAKDIKDSLNWWGVSNVTVLKFKLMKDIDLNKIPEKKRAAMFRKLEAVARKLSSVDYSKPAHTDIVAKAKFYIVRMMQTGLGKDNPEYHDFKYWKENGWIGTVRPWK